MPIGYSADARLAAKKVELDIATSKLKRVRDEYEKIEGEYAVLLAQARHAGFIREDVVPKVEKIKKPEGKKE